MSDIPSGFINIDVFLSDSHPEAQEVLVSYAAYFAKMRVTRKNVSLFIKLLSTNIPAVAEKIFEEKDPLSFFSTVNFQKEGLIKVTEILSHHAPGELHVKILLACLGILQKAYTHPESGMDTFPLSFSHMQHIAKYLQREEREVQSSIIDFLHALQSLPARYPVAKYAAELTDAYLDRSKGIRTLLPQSLHISVTGS